MRALRREPGLLVGEGVRLEQDVALGILERRASHARHGKAADAHRPVHRLAFRKVRRPAPVVQGVGRRNLHLVDHREAVGHDTRVRLGAADHLGAVALNDDEDPHSIPAR